jgi:hypothetical protein
VTAPSVAIAGTGEFAGALARALARHPHPLRLHVLGGDPGRARDLAELAADHATLAGTRTTCTPHHLDPADARQLRHSLAALRPDVLVLAASEHSPAEARATPSAWTDLLGRAGFGLTLPLQAARPRTLAAACADASPDTVLVNACFPDAVNPLLRAGGTPVACGLGNIATLAATLRTCLGLGDQGRLHLLAHHAHLHAPADPEQDARAWLDGEPLPDLHHRLAAVRRRPRHHLNEIGAVAGAAAVAALAGAGPVHTGHLPGPDGLPGGYPVTVHHRGVQLRLPRGLTREQAVAWNLRRGELDGAVVDPDGTTRLAPTALAALRSHWPDAPATYGPHELPAMHRELLRLRAQLRLLPTRQPQGSTSHHDHHRTDRRQLAPAGAGAAR